MHCRSILLLEKELRELQHEPIWGVSLHQVPNHPLVCFANLSGFKNSLWEKATFHITLYFSEHYNEETPEIVFNTIPFHPNVDSENGKLVINFSNLLQQNHQKEVNLSSLLISIQELLSNPVLDEAVNQEAKLLLINSPQEYEAMVEQCVAESRRLFGVLDEKMLESYFSLLPNDQTKINVIKETPKETNTSVSVVVMKPKQVSFDVYHKAWVDVATTKPTNIINSKDDDQATLEMWHPTYSSIRSLSPSSSIRVASHAHRTQPSKLDLVRKRKLEKIDALKQLYMNKSDTQAAPPTTAVKDQDERQTTGWDDEAEELLAWTDSLNTEQMMAS